MVSEHGDEQLIVISSSVTNDNYSSSTSASVTLYINTAVEWSSLLSTNIR